MTKSLNDANRACNGIQKELKTVDKLLKLDPGNMTLVTQKSELLGDSIKETKNALKELEQSQAQVTAQYEAKEIDAGQYRKFQQDLVQTKASLKSLENEQKSVTGISGAFAVLKGKVSEVNEKLEPLTNGIKKVGQMSASVFSVGGKALIAYGTAAATAGIAIAKMTGDAAQAADDINTLSKITGLSSEQIQRFQYATDVVDVSMDTLTGSMAKLTKNMGNAKSGTGAAAEAFDTLGVSITDSNGELRNNQDVFNDAIGALGKMTNETERDALAMQIFGKSAQDLNPLIEGGAQALSALGDSASEAGLILSQDALDSLNAYQDSLDILKANASASGKVLAGTFAPGLTAAASALSSAIPSLVGFVSQLFSGGDISSATVGMTTYISGIANKAVESISKNLPALLAGFNGVVLSVVGGISSALPQAVTTILPAIMQGLTDLITGLVALIPVVLPALIEGAAVLFTGIITGLTQIIPQIIEMLPTLVTQICGVLIENLPLLLDATLQIIIAVACAIIQNFPQILTSVSNGLSNIFAALGTWFSGLFTSLGTWLLNIGTSIIAFFVNAETQRRANMDAMWLSIGAWFGNLLSGVETWLASVITNIISFAASMVQNAISATKGFVTNILNGIAGLPGGVGNTLIAVISSVAEFVKNMIEKAIEAASGFARNIIDGFAELPSQMMDVGGNIVKGIWDGISSGWKWLTDSISNLAGNLLRSTKKALGINSPSTKYRDEVGKNMALGIGVGFAEQMQTVRKTMARAIPANFTSLIHANVQESTRNASSATSGTAINVNVKNYSPKALSPAESARLTRNALRTFVLQTGGVW